MIRVLLSALCSLQRRLSYLVTRRPEIWDCAPSQENSERQPVEVLGLGDQHYYVRTPCRQPRESSQERLKRARESQVWPQASQRVGRAPEGVRWVRVADREADIYE